MATKKQIQDQIQVDITSKTTANSITPIIMGVVLSGITEMDIPTITDTYGGNAILNGGVIPQSGLTSYVWGTKYIIDDALYNEAVNGFVTHSTGDTSNSRIDVYVINNDASGTTSVGIVEGTPDVNPIKPNIDFLTQVEVGFKIVQSMETSFTGLTKTIIYDENLGNPTEWNNTITGGDPSYTGDTFSGSTAYNVPTPSNITFNTPTPLVYGSDTTLVFAIKITATPTNTARGRVRLSDGSTNSNYLTINRTNSAKYNIDWTMLNVWQTASIRLLDFKNLPSQIDTVKFLTIDTPSLIIDRIYLQGGSLTTSIGEIPTKTSQLINDGEDGVNPFITALDITGNTGDTPALIYSGTSIYPTQGTNVSTGTYSTIGGGYNNTVTDKNGTIAGGSGNTVSSTYSYTGIYSSTIGGGVNNTNSGDYSTISGGRGNTISGGYNSTINGGRDNTITSGGTGSSVSGYYNTASNRYTVIGGGYNNTASGEYSIIGGGADNIASGFSTTISGGVNNQATGGGSTVAGGKGNTASGNYSFTSGRNNTASGSYSNVCGFFNLSSSYGEFVGGIYSTDYTPSSYTQWVESDRLFNIGNGSRLTASPAIRSDAFQILKSGEVIAPSLTTAIITSGDTKVLITKEYGDANYGGALIYSGTSIYPTQGINISSGTFSTISGGYGNTTSGSYSIIGGGKSNTASSFYSIIGGGTNNTVLDRNSVIGGGSGNTISIPGTTVSGYYPYNSSIIGGGAENTISGVSCTIGGGYQNTSSGEYNLGTTIGGGKQNTASGYYATIGGGWSNNANGNSSTIAGGDTNTAINRGTIGGGSNNLADGNATTIGGGVNNQATGGGGSYSVVGGGSSNVASGKTSTIGGGFRNTTSGYYSTIGGGDTNTASGFSTTISGGQNNTANGGGSTVAGGKQNTVNTIYSSIVGGSGNTITNGDYSIIGGGKGNTASGYYSTVIGGQDNTAWSWGETVGGMFGTLYTGTSQTSWSREDRIFNIGNGINQSNLSDAFQILKSGEVIAPSLTTAIITSGDSKVLITREYGDANYGGGATVPIARTGSTVVFDVPAVYNEASPATGNITLDETGQVVGTVSSIFHKSLTEPTFVIPLGKKVWVRLGEYKSDNVATNIIYLTTTPTGDYEVSYKYYDSFQYGYEPELQTVITTALAASEPLPLQVDLIKLGDFVTTIKNLQYDDNTENYINLFDVCDFIGVFYLSDKDEFVKYNIVTGAKEVTDFSGGLTLGVEGYQGQNTNAMEIVDDLNNYTHYTQDDASITLYIKDNSLSSYFLGNIGVVDNTMRTAIGSNATTSLFGALNCQQVTIASANFGADGVFMIDRNSSVDFNMYVNGVLDNTTAGASTGIPEIPFIIGARNFAAAANLYTNGKLGLCIIGASIREVQARLNTAIQTFVS